MVNPAGSKAVKWIDKLNRVHHDWKFRGRTAASVREHPEGGKWYVELSAPFSAYVKTGKVSPGDKWVVNVVRSRRAHGGEAQLSTLSPLVQGKLNQPDKFEVIEFK